MNALAQPLKPAYYAEVEKQLRRIFYVILYQPLQMILQKATAQRALENAPEDPLRDALRSGRIQYQAGIFSGEFSAAISKALRSLGAKFEPRMRIYRIHPGQLPPWVQQEATSYWFKAKNTHDQLMRTLNETAEHLAELVKAHPVDPNKSIAMIESGFKSAADHLKVNPKLSPEGHAALRKEYTQNMDLWIQEWTGKEIKALRGRVEENAVQGYRFDRLITSLNHRLSISDNHAKFLARQETSLFLAKFREQRFKDAGVRRYRWSTAHDDRVRHDHKHLDGKVYGYDEPPIVDQGTGRRGNPGQDYNCRCVDIPVLEGLER